MVKNEKSKKEHSVLATYQFLNSEEWKWIPIESDDLVGTWVPSKLEENGKGDWPYCLVKTVLEMAKFMGSVFETPYSIWTDSNIIHERLKSYTKNSYKWNFQFLRWEIDRFINTEEIRLWNRVYIHTRKELKDDHKASKKADLISLEFRKKFL